MTANQSTKVCNIGIIGAGRIGKLHAENIKHHLPQFSLKAIADPFINQEWGKQLGIELVSQHVQDVLFHDDIDAVVIASPSHLHLEQIKAASEANKAIFCEKPIGLSEEEIKATLELVNKNKTLLQLGFNRRFDPSFADLQRRIKTGDIGAPHIVRITSRDPACPSKEYIATSGGIFMDMSIHDFDMARFLTQSEVIEVFASGAVLINPEFSDYQDVDTAVITLRFANGALGVIDNSRQAVYGYDQRVEVFGSLGMLQAENQLNTSVSHYGAQSTSHANPKYFFLERYQEAYISEFTAFYDAWANQQVSPVSGEDGLKALQIAKAAKKSLDTGMPVQVGRD